MPVENSVVVITGGSSGIGLAIAREMLTKGAKGVVITGRSKEKLDKALDELVVDFGKDRAQGIACDATSWEDNLSLMKVTNDTYGQIDYVFANATGRGNSPLYSLYAKPNYDAYALMLTSVSYTVHAALPYLTSSSSAPVTSYAAKPADGPGRDRGIFVTGSEAAFVGYTPNPEYGAVKSALVGMVWSLKERVAQVGVRINLLAPGYIDTPIVATSRQLGTVRDEDLIPMPRVIELFMRFVNDTSLSGVVTRIQTPDSAPIDMLSESLPAASWTRWGPFIERVEMTDSKST